MTINKVIYGNTTLIDLTADTVTESDILAGKTAHDKSGAAITGTCDYDSNTQDANAAVAEILTGKTAYARGAKLTGTMPNNGAYSNTIATANGTVTIPLGFHDGSGVIGIDATEKIKLTDPSNIKAGVSLMGTIGTYTGEGVTAQAKTVDAYTTQQTVLPDSGYDYLSQVVVNAIAYTETLNAAGGYTATIGTVAS